MLPKKQQGVSTRFHLIRYRSSAVEITTAMTVNILILRFNAARVAPFPERDISFDMRGGIQYFTRRLTPTDGSLERYGKGHIPCFLLNSQLLI